MSTPTTVVELLQTPRYSRPHVDSEVSVVYMLDSLEWREGDPEGDAMDLLCLGRSLMDLGLTLVPKEESYQLLYSFLEDLEQEDEFLEGEQFVLDESNRIILETEFASRMAEAQYKLLTACGLKKSRLYELHEGMKEHAWLVRSERLRSVLMEEVAHWLEKVPRAISTQPSLNLRLQQHLLRN